METPSQAPNVRELFGLTAAEYDRARRQLIPRFDDFYGTALDLIPYTADDAFHVLDLGAGTGLLSALISEAFPKATFTLVDIAPEMLERARVRFAGRKGFDFLVTDLTGDMPDVGASVIVSALAIHHLDDDGKRDLFRRIHGVLPSGGVFINAEQILGPTPQVHRRYKEVWLRDVRALGVSEEDLAAAQQRMTADLPSTIGDQVQWLVEAGFEDANCWFQHYMFAVYSGRKG